MIGAPKNGDLRDEPPVNLPTQIDSGALKLRFAHGQLPLVKIKRTSRFRGQSRAARRSNLPKKRVGKGSSDCADVAGNAADDGSQISSAEEALVSR
jgi:hypothetical protein